MSRDNNYAVALERPSTGKKSDLSSSAEEGTIDNFIDNFHQYKILRNWLQNKYLHF